VADDVDVVAGVLGDRRADAGDRRRDATGVLAADEDDRRLDLLCDPPDRPHDVRRHGGDGTHVAGVLTPDCRPGSRRLDLRAQAVRDGHGVVGLVLVRPAALGRELGFALRHDRQDDDRFVHRRGELRGALERRDSQVRPVERDQVGHTRPCTRWTYNSTPSNRSVRRSCRRQLSATIANFHYGCPRSDEYE
jgi:hypothetical protein